MLDLKSVLEELRDNLEDHFSHTDRYESIESANEVLEQFVSLDLDELEAVIFKWESTWTQVLAHQPQPRLRTWVRIWAKKRPERSRIADYLPGSMVHSEKGE